MNGNKKPPTPCNIQSLGGFYPTIFFYTIVSVHRLKIEVWLAQSEFLRKDTIFGTNFQILCQLFNDILFVPSVCFQHIMNKNQQSPQFLLYNKKICEHQITCPEEFDIEGCNGVFEDYKVFDAHFPHSKNIFA